ncbi:MAG TPA: hypothetical protein VFX49_09600 [Chloroflexota bacterium]|nr:hypothetical protein [Chloroflexota bacterium]
MISFSSIRRLVAGIAGLYALVGSLQVMKSGAAHLASLEQGIHLLRDSAATLAMGWIGAMVVLSGSPIAATALTLLAGGSIGETSAFTMLVGSRLGAAFAVLLVASVYAMRGGDGQRKKPLSVAVMALITTTVVYVPGAFLGWILLQWPGLRDLSLLPPAQFGDLLDLLYGAALARVASWPPLALLMGGLVLLLASFSLLDVALPEIAVTDVPGAARPPHGVDPPRAAVAPAGMSRAYWLRRKWLMFWLGCGVALVTMSVSVALSILVPLVARDRVRREEIVPYIMGANITTLGDTLLAAFLLASPAGVRVVLAAIAGVSLVSLALLAFCYPLTLRGIWFGQRYALMSRVRLAACVAPLAAVPLAIVALRV